MKVLLLVFLVAVLLALLHFSRGSEVTSNLDSYIYDLPFKAGTSHKVVQGYGGLFSHKNKAALDFAISEGTPVYAARGGTVYRYKDESDEGGPFVSERKANYVIIQHGDGSFGCYWHLKQYGVVTKEGFVSKGQLIGYSGQTGFALWPHLHFTIKRKLSCDKESFVRTRFRTTKGIELLNAGETYEKPL